MHTIQIYSIVFISRNVSVYVCYYVVSYVCNDVRTYDVSVVSVHILITAVSIL